MKKKKINTKEVKRRAKQSDYAKFGAPLYTPEAELTATPTKVNGCKGYALRKSGEG